MASDTRTMSTEGPSAVSGAATMGSDKGRDERPLPPHSITPLISALGATDLSDFYAQVLMRLETPTRYILSYGLNDILSARRQCTTHSKSFTLIPKVVTAAVSPRGVSVMALQSTSQIGEGFSK